MLRQNMKKRGRLLLVLSILFFIPLIFAIPQSHTINGRLTNANGVAVEGSQTMNLSIYDAYSGGNNLWTSGDKSVITDSNGVYNVVINPTGLNYSENYDK